MGADGIKSAKQVPSRWESILDYPLSPKGPGKWKREAGCQRPKGSRDDENRGVSDETVISADERQPPVGGAGSLWELETTGGRSPPRICRKKATLPTP